MSLTAASIAMLILHHWSGLLHVEPHAFSTPCTGISKLLGRVICTPEDRIIPPTVLRAARATTAYGSRHDSSGMLHPQPHVPGCVVRSCFLPTAVYELSRSFRLWPNQGRTLHILTEMRPRAIKTTAPPTFAQYSHTPNTHTELPLQT